MRLHEGIERGNAVDRTFDLLDAIAAQPGWTLADIAETCSIPRSSAHRLIVPLVARKLVVVVGKGRCFPGPSALALSSKISFRDLLIVVARPHLVTLSRQCGTHAHLGLFEDGMVTYAIKQQFGRSRLFSREGAQLEAYCTALGKILLAQLEPASLASYLTQDSFVALTENTITDAGKLRSEIDLARERRWASECGETMKGLSCIAVPLLTRGTVVSALSLSFQREAITAQAGADYLPQLYNAATQIASDLREDAKSR